MQSQDYDELVRLARLCFKHAGATSDPHTARQLRQMAREYQQRAAKLDGGHPPEFGEDTSFTGTLGEKVR